MNAIAALGRRVIERVQGIGVATLMLLQILFSMPTWLGLRLFIYQMYRVGVLSLLIIVVSGLFIGAVLGLQMFSILSTFGSESMRSEEHTSELQSRENLVCRLLLEKKKK